MMFSSALMDVCRVEETGKLFAIFVCLALRFEKVISHRSFLLSFFVLHFVVVVVCFFSSSFLP